MPTVELNKLYKIAFVDPAGGPAGQRARSGLSRAAIMVIGQDQLERVFILSNWAQRIAPNQLIDRIFETQERWRPVTFGIDASGPQLMFAQIIKTEAHQRGIKWHPRPIALKADKTFSIENTLQPIAAQGRLFRLPESECRSLADEYHNFPDGMYRDQMDALACAIRLLPIIIPENQRLMSREQLRAYLQRTGMAPDQIFERLDQHDRLAAR